MVLLTFTTILLLAVFSIPTFLVILTKLSTQRGFAMLVPLFVQNLSPSALNMPRLPDRAVEEFAEDFRKTKKILRPNPDWEEDLVQTCEVTPEIRERVKTYSQFKKKKPRIECCCQEATTKPGVAPLIELNDGHTIPNLGLGTWLGFDKSGETVVAKDDAVQKAVEIAIEAGYRLIDTAAKYTTEEQVRKGIEAKIAEGVVSREDLCIVTKLWNDRHAKKDVVPALKESLARLGLEYLDIYLIHFPVAVYDNNTFYDVDYLETWEGLIEAKALGLVKSIGVSNFNITQLDRLISMSKVKPAVLQIEVNLNIQEPELIKFCKKHNIAVMAYTPFGSLFHNKAAKDAPPPRTDDQALLKIAARHHKTVAQINLRYLIELGVIPIPKSVTKKRIEANIEVFDFQLSHLERQILKKFDRNYRTLDVSFWADSPHYPFKKDSIL